MDFPHINDIRALPYEKQVEFFENLTPLETMQFQYHWPSHARDKQLLPDKGWYEALFLCGRGYGKESSLDTLVLTPSGFVKLGDISIGDKVIDENGKECNVLAIYENDPDVKRYYKLTFSDGTEVKCCSDHLWTTWTHRDRKSYNRNYKYAGGKKPTKLPEDWPNWKPIRKTKRFDDFDIGPSVKTTQEIIDTFTHSKRKDINHSIPVCKPIEFSEKDLLVDPYILGYWLGDGCCNSSSIAVDKLDEENIKKYVLSSGYKIGNNSDLYILSALGLITDLKKINADRKESIPNDYYIGSIEQRLSLLQGLMDSDGFIHKKNGYVEFSQSREWISDLVYYLAASLGQKPTKNENKSQLNGEYKQNRFRVTWRPIWDINPFRLQRKAKLVKPDGKQSLRNYHRMIVSYEEIDKEPMRCLTVDSPNNLFLVTKAMIPTHNTRLAAEATRNAVENQGCMRLVLIGPTVGDVRDVMFGGDSGLDSISPPWNKPIFVHSKAKIIWPNGAEALVKSAEEPESLRGPQFDWAWWDEPARCKKAQEIYDGIHFGLRLDSQKGYPPRLLMTTTPRAIPLIKDLAKRYNKGEEGLLLITGNTNENKNNLTKKFISRLDEKYGGTRLGRQELNAEILEDHPDALWPDAVIDDCKVFEDDVSDIVKFLETMERVVVGVDPSGSDGFEGDETGIIVAGKRGNIFYVFCDDSIQGSPETWASRVQSSYKDYLADKIIAEKNNGGTMVRAVLQADWPSAPVYTVHAKRGKHLRAQPISRLYEQGRVKHLKDFSELEAQMSEMTLSGYKGSGSPDRVDALVYALMDLSGKNNVSKFDFKVQGFMY